MSTQFHVKRIDSLLAPSLCSEVYGSMNYFGGFFIGSYSLGLAGYIGMGCYLLGY